MSKKASNPPPITCAVKGQISPNMVCGDVLVGGEFCGKDGWCVHQLVISKPAIPVPIKVERNILEKHVEAYLYKKMKKLGGECYKWSSMNMRGVPDRVCVFPPNQHCPNGIITFVELKKDTKAKLSAGQAKFFKRMEQMRVSHCYVLHGKEEVDLWLKSMGHDI